jgi:cytochrome c6
VADLAAGATFFNTNCAACYIGGNVVNGAKTLKADALVQFGMNSLEAIQNQVTNGKAAMPAFKGRLTPEEIANAAAYVLDQSDKGW